MSWREAAAPVIAEVVREVGVQDPRALRRALTAAYPFGMRSGWPYNYSPFIEVHRCDQLSHFLVRFVLKGRFFVMHEQQVIS